MTLMHNVPLKFCLRWFSFTAYFALYLQLYYNNLSISKVINNCLENVKILIANILNIFCL